MAEKSPIKRILGVVLRVGVSIGLIAWVFSLIPFADTIEFEYADGSRKTAVIEQDVDLLSLELMAVRHKDDQLERLLAPVPEAPGETVEDQAGRKLTWRPGFLTTVKRVNMTAFAGVLLILFIGPLLTWIRWWDIVRSQDIPIRLREAIRIAWIGFFANNFLPGSTGGDVPRMVMVARRTDRKFAAAGTVLVDRLLGLACMVLLACVVLAFGGAQRDELKLPSMVGLSLLVCILVFGSLYLSSRFRRTKLWNWIWSVVPFSAKLKEIDSVFVSLRQHPRMFMAGIGLSFAGQVAIVLAVYVLGLSIGISEAALLDYFVFVPIIMMLSAIPISFNAWGYGEALYIKFFGLVGVISVEALALSLLLKIGIVLVSLPGGLFLLKSKQEETPEQPEAEPVPNS